MKIKMPLLTLIFVIAVVIVLVFGTLQIINQGKHDNMPGMPGMNAAEQMEQAQGRGK